MPYCSGICCMYTAKQAILLKEHCHDAQAYVFYIDIRATKKNYEQFVLRAQRDYGVIHPGATSKIAQKGDKLVVKGADALGRDTGRGRSRPGGTGDSRCRPAGCR